MFLKRVMLCNIRQKPDTCLFDLAKEISYRSIFSRIYGRHCAATVILSVDTRRLIYLIHEATCISSCSVYDAFAYAGRITRFITSINLLQVMEHQQGRKQTMNSTEVAKANEEFDLFCNATTLKSILGHFRHLCELLKIRPNTINQFYPKLRLKLRSWKAQALWKKFDQRANHKCYNRGKACPNTRVSVPRIFYIRFRRSLSFLSLISLYLAVFNIMA